MIQHLIDLCADAAPGVRPRTSSRNHRSGRTQALRQAFHSLSFKFTLFTFILIAAITYLIATTISGILDEELQSSALQRGAAVADTLAGPASFSLLSQDRLALDNLVARIHDARSEFAYLAILDAQGEVVAHSQLAQVGTVMTPSTGPLVLKRDELKVIEVQHNGVRLYEFTTPIRFAGRKVGQAVVGFDTRQLEATRREARQKIALLALAALTLGILGSVFLARFVTRPICLLSAAVSRITVGDTQVAVPVRSEDEIGALTRNFNDMARVIRVQRDNLVHYAHDLEESYNAIVRTLAGALDARDNYTYGHSARVASLASGLGRRLGFGYEELKELEMACLLHDIGKIRVPDNILNKQARLNDIEYGQIKDHPVYGAQILELAESLQKYLPVVLHHHEWYDGSGYPHQLRSTEIPLHAQIVALADAYDAMTSCRPYRPGRDRDAAVNEIRAFKGSQFDPELAELFIDSLADYREEAEPAPMDDVACG